MAAFANPKVLLEIVAAQKQGRPVGIYSVCSANRFVLEACLRQADQDGSHLLIEATCNQVNQFGGYTGMTAADFAAYVARIAGELRFPPERVILGGDHLGPNPWQNQPAETAMAHARTLIESYVHAGFRKIHIDASMRLGGDDLTRPLDPRLSAERAAELCQAAEASAEGQMPVYIIGTEVPIPGGAQEAEESLQITRPQDAAAELDLFRQVFEKYGLNAAWERVMGLVVQPGVEFGDANLFEYERAKARDLSRWIETIPGILFEAHSTDYQNGSALKQMVEDHFAILKVGPGLTFAFREAVFALAWMETEWLGGRPDVQLSNLAAGVEAAMLANPRDWAKYYHGSERELAFARKYSFSDRIRYYWPQPEVEAALARLLDNLEQHPLPLPLISQYLPVQYAHLREGRVFNTPRELIWDHIQETAAVYAGACKAG
jgi:D-tagatose-1,6-bisphosphate aldolase subunit GatZ/KbaZ